jgi:hypothetical protein
METEWCQRFIDEYWHTTAHRKRGISLPSINKHISLIRLFRFQAAITTEEIRKYVLIV